MSAVAVTGAVLVILGVVHMARAAIARGRLSDASRATGDKAVTLEPSRRDAGFLGLGVHAPGLMLAVIGGVMLLLPLIF